MKVKNKVNWTLTYKDGSKCEHEGEPFGKGIRRHGVQIVVQDDERTGRRILHSSDGVWLWRAERWFASDTMGLWDYLMHHDGPLYVLLGSWLPDEEYEQIYHEEQGKKSAWHPLERKV